MEKISFQKSSFTNRELALIAGLGAIAIVYGYSSSVLLGNSINTLDIFLVLAIIFTVLKCMTGKEWSATLLGLIASPVYLFIPSVPLPFHVSIAVILNGFIFDLYLRLGHDRFHYSRRHLLVAGGLGSFVMSAITLAVFRVFGPAFDINIPLFVYPIALVTTSIVGAVGVILGITIARRIGAQYVPTKTVKLSRKVAVRTSS